MTIPCPKCNGSGRVFLPCLLNAVRQRLRGGRTAPELLDQFPGVGVTALNNRLEKLRALGLVTRKREGRAWRYWAAKRG